MDEQNGVEKVDFEIAFTAFLSSSVLTFQVPDVAIYPYLRIAALSLLFLTLVRRAAIAEENKNTGKFLNSSEYLLNFFTNISILYLFYSISVGISGYNPVLSTNTAFIFIILTIFGGFTLLLFYEIILSTAIKEGINIFAKARQNHQGTMLGIFFINIESFVKKGRADIYETETVQTKLGRYNEVGQDVSPEQAVTAFKAFTKFFVGAFVLPLGLMALLVLSGTRLFRISWVTSVGVLLSIVIVNGLVDLLYSNYGLVEIGDRNGYIQFGQYILTYLIMGLILFSESLLLFFHSLF